MLQSFSQNISKITKNYMGGGWGTVKFHGGLTNSFLGGRGGGNPGGH